MHYGPVSPASSSFPQDFMPFKSCLLPGDRRGIPATTGGSMNRFLWQHQSLRRSGLASHRIVAVLPGFSLSGPRDTISFSFAESVAVQNRELIGSFAAFSVVASLMHLLDKYLRSIYIFWNKDMFLKICQMLKFFYRDGMGTVLPRVRGIKKKRFTGMFSRFFPRRAHAPRAPSAHRPL
jgi:hypothetical protein